jgi:hypothetical protein
VANLSKEARLDRKRKEADEILLRSDDAYLEIEQFKEYEFSWCIAFEMAKRDPKLLKEVHRFIAFYKKQKEYITFIPFSEAFEEAFEYRLHRRAKAIFTYGYDYLAQEHWLNHIDLYCITYDETALEMSKVYVHQFNDIKDKLPNERFTRKDEEGILFESSVNFNNEHFFDDNETVSDEAIVEAIEEFDIDPSLIESQRKATENFSRPKLSIPALYNKSIQVELNLALPKNELLAYVSLIKEKYDEEKSLVKSTVELLETNTLSISLEAIDAEQVYKKDKRKTLPEKCADLFFIYDCQANNLSMDYTIDRLNRYWNEERKAFPEKFQIKTYKRYLKLAKEFIEKRQYQSLLIGS